MMEQGVKKYYLEDFFYWVQDIGDYTGEIMGEILKTKADTMAINIVLNSFNTVYNDVFPFTLSILFIHSSNSFTHS